MQHLPTLARQQRGMALLIGLLLLVMLTAFGVSAVKSSVGNERLSGVTRDRNAVFQAAEAALRDGEQWLESLKLNGEPPGCAASAALHCTSTLAPDEDGSMWSNGPSRTHSTLVEFDPRYYVEARGNYPVSKYACQPGSGDKQRGLEVGQGYGASAGNCNGSRVYWVVSRARSDAGARVELRSNYGITYD